MTRDSVGSRVEASQACFLPLIAAYPELRTVSNLKDKPMSLAAEGPWQSLKGRAELDLDRTPAAIAQLHDRVHLNAVVVSVMEHLAIEGLGQHPQVADHQRLETASRATPDL